MILLQCIKVILLWPINCGPILIILLWELPQIGAILSVKYNCALNALSGLVAIRTETKQNPHLRSFIKTCKLALLMASKNCRLRTVCCTDLAPKFFFYFCLLCYSGRLGTGLVHCCLDIWPLQAEMSVFICIWSGEVRSDHKRALVWKRMHMWARYLLFKISPVLFIHQHQIKEVAHRELLVDISHGGCQVISWQEVEDAMSHYTFEWNCAWNKDDEADTQCSSNLNCLYSEFIYRVGQRREEWGEELPARNNLMGMDSPLTGAPSMISYFATVSVSVVVLGPEDDNIYHSKRMGVTVCCLPLDT